MSSRAAGGNDNTIELLILDGIFDLIDAGLGTGVEVLFHEYDIGQGLRILSQARAVQIASDVAAAVTDKDSDTSIFGQFHTSVLSPRRTQKTQRKSVFLFVSFLVVVRLQSYLKTTKFYFSPPAAAFGAVNKTSAARAAALLA